jgi:signal peptidase I
MTATNTSAAPSPWRTTWLAPRETIARLVATDPRRDVLLLAVLGGVSGLIGNVIAERPAWLTSSWQLPALTVVGGALVGVISLYLTGFLLRWSGRLLGGAATQAETRAAVAWSSLPNIASLAIYLVALLVLVVWPEAIDREILAIILLVAAGLLAIWTVILQVAMLSRAHRFGIGRAVLSYLMVAVLAWLIVPVTIRTLLLQPFNIPSGAQIPTLMVGDYLFVSKYSYGYSRFSLPFSPPVFAGRIFGAEPERGDVVAFRLPRDTSTDYIKRVIGLPGDRIQVIKGHLHINGAPVTRQQIEDFVGHEDGPAVRRIKRWRETLPNGVSYDILDREDDSFYDNTRVYQVPAGHYFMMGDNRDNSTDSRALAQVGYVPFENLIGRATIIYFSVAERENGGATPRLGRIGTLVR